MYVHFPWCLKKCPYCDFVSFATDPATIDHDGYADAVVAELSLRALPEGQLTSVFFGGGTPSLWRPAALGRVLDAILQRAAEAGRAASPVEITVECNPSSLDEAHARALLEQGVNRLSIGVQSLDAERLAFLGRWHDAPGALAAVRAAVRSGMPRVSADLIHGVAAGPGGRVQSPEEAAAEVAEIAALGVDHVSAYGLIIEPNTRFGELARAGSLPVLDDSRQADIFVAVGEALVAAGLYRYEVSNFARTSAAESLHNLGYWRGDDYLGLGCAAFGTVGAQRYRNTPSVEKYMRGIAAGHAIEQLEALSPETRLRERIMLGLRMREGVDLGRARSDLGIEPWTRARTQIAAELVAQGKLVRDGDRLRVDDAGWLYVDALAAALF